MDQARWQRLQDLLDGAWGVPDAERAAWLDEHCNDSEVRAKAERLLALDEEAESYFGRLGSDVGFEAGDDDRVAEPQADLSGRRVGNYRLLEPLGRGGMGVVYLAERADGTFEHQVAVKLLAMGVSTPEMRSRFVTERQILADLEHPAIARLLDGGVAEDGTPYFVMERVDGERIDRWCDARRAGLRQRLELLCRVCDAVEYAHRRLVIHRDLKPSNVLVTEDGEPKLLDFGVAKLLADPESGLTASGLTVSGGAAPLTPTWAAPEQIEHGRVTTATDTYALGALACLLLAGAPPRDFDRRTPAAIARQMKEEPTAPSRRLASLSDEEEVEVAAARGLDRQGLARRLAGDLDAIVLKALAYEPERRYGSAAELAVDLKAHLAGRPVTARAPSLRYRASRFVARHRVGVAAASAIVTLLLSLVGVSVKSAIDSRRQAEQVAAERDRAQQVTHFLKGLFKATDPDVAQGREITARELLDQGARRMSADSSFADNPDLRVEMQVLLGDLYRQIGDLDAAEPLLSASLESAGADTGPETRAEALHALGTLEMDTGEHEQALERLEQAERVLEDAGLVPGRRHASLMTQLLFTLSELGRVEEAARRGEAALAAARTAPELPPESLFAYLQATSQSLREAQQDERAEPLLREALALEVEETEEPTTRMALLSDLAAVVGESGALEEALAYRQQAVALADEVLDPLHPTRARLLNNLGHSLSALGRFDDAEAALREALAIYESIYAESQPPRVAAAHNNLGSMLRYAERYNAAEPHMARAREMAAELFGTDDPRYTIATANLGDLQRRLGRYREAERLLTEAIETRRRVLGPDHPMVGTALSVLAALRLVEGDAREALILTTDALELFQSTGYDRPDVLINVLGRQAQALAGLERAEEAEAAFGRALAIREQAGAAAGTAGPEILGLYARFLVEHGPAEAPAAVERAIEAHRTVLGEAHPATRRIEELPRAAATG